MEVAPFRGIRYNEAVVGDLAKVICRPYDVISPEQQILYYNENDYNAVRLEFPKPTTHRYQRAALTFQQWLKQDVLRIDTVPAFYLHEHEFKYSGRKMVRRGVIARVKLEPWGSGIFPHEETSSKARSDRLQLMQACRANFSPLFALYQDSERKIAEILHREAQEKPLTIVEAERGNLLDPDEGHRVWRVTDPEMKRELSELLSAQPIYIADGHHRYETGLTYQRGRAQEQSDSADSAVVASEVKQSVTTEKASDYVMMELAEFSDPGLVVLPLHRLVRGIAFCALTGLEKQLSRLFTLESVSFGDGSLARGQRDPLALSVVGSEAKKSRGVQGTVLGILGLHAGALTLLRRRQDVSLEAMMPANRSQTYREFGVSILNHIVLDGILSEEKDIEIAYTVDVEEAYQQITKGKYQLAFLLHPPQPGMVKAIADAQDRMPGKSTYFYPKVPAGLVINSLD